MTIFNALKAYFIGINDYIMKNGYSLNEAETFDYVYGVGTAILDIQGRAIAAISLSGTKGTINLKTIPDLAKKVIETSSEISSKLSKDY